MCIADHLSVVCHDSVAQLHPTHLSSSGSSGSSTSADSSFEIHQPCSTPLPAPSSDRSMRVHSDVDEAHEQMPPSYISDDGESLRPAKRNLFGRLFRRDASSTERSARLAEKTVNGAGPSLPSYRDVEIAEAWAKVGIDVNNPKQGPAPHCTPQEWLTATDELFGLPAPAKPKARVVTSTRTPRRISGDSMGSSEEATNSIKGACSLKQRIRASGWA